MGGENERKHENQGHGIIAVESPKHTVQCYRK